MSGADGTRRVLLLALDPRLSDRVLAFAAELTARRVEVLLVVAAEAAAGPGIDPGVRVRWLLGAGERTPLRALENLLVRPAPANRVGRLARRVPGLLYGQLRAALLARRGVRRLRPDELGHIDAIVAGDIDSVALGCRLARRRPGVLATSALKLELLADRAA
ncbi:hypothetical protein [Plantactinospora sp. CA-290183]|uniref:hypothetical protein n=1 Tax=Plantactinospora sp. CA-290183 TaxID=3240006 RepID=UPI003D8AF3C1